MIQFLFTISIFLFGLFGGIAIGTYRTINKIRKHEAELESLLNKEKV